MTRQHCQFLLAMFVGITLLGMRLASAGEVLDEGGCLAEDPTILALGKEDDNGYAPEMMVQLSLNQNAYVFVDVVCDFDRTVYKRLAGDEFRGVGTHVFLWDALDDKGAPVLYNNASFRIAVTNDPNSCFK